MSCCANLFIAVLLGGSFVSPAVQATTPPNDGWVIWQSPRTDARNEIYRARADGTEITRVTHTGATKPLWSPDGRWIAFGSESGEVFVIRPDGSAAKKLSAVGFPVSWRHDNGGLLIAEGNQYSIVDPDTKDKIPFFQSQ